ncbi:uncharacterized protein A1O9_07464 [Exophiala aquamarina CBS 119918]|uniref:BZIP domain-containing protein n=1 Tax=Exophiala aquamarina CBS 119918 TaxID=1182545 RepID=A0A072P700_9EURO|nr:uncharacterized protein A1O9_07464 [Exophiala aquamarina CBS 119918]KEF55884.1 hypothetical protein A1O9_07464 [Exophiala aquamarina CBS 119918]
METPGRLRLGYMDQLAEAHCDDDNWTGLKDPKERRKRQVRLSLRAHRKRKAAQLAEREMPLHPNIEAESGTRHVIYPPSDNQAVRTTPNLFIPAALDQRGSFVPMRNLYPMSRDHLLPLVQYNAWRATLTNVLILGHLHLISQQTCRFGSCTTIFPNPYQRKSLPESLKPTELQRSTSYPDWIDIMPSPRMRDNATRTQRLISNAELCADLMGGISGKQHNIESAIIVWSDPWEPRGWELSQGFIRRWWFLVEGCNDLFEATNRWRDLRGDDPLVFERP